MNVEAVGAADEVGPFDPKTHPAVRQAKCSIRAFGIEFHSRYGVLSELRAMINVVETWLPRGLFWHIEQIDFDSKHGTIRVRLKDRQGSMTGAAHQIAETLKTYMGDLCMCVSVEDHNGRTIAGSG